MLHIWHRKICYTSILTKGMLLNVKSLQSVIEVILVAVLYQSFKVSIDIVTKLVEVASGR